MSSILWRRRLRERAGQQQAATPFTPAPIQLPAEALAEVTVVQPPAAVVPAPVESQPEPLNTPAIVPQSMSTAGMTPADLRTHAQHTAVMLAQLPTEEYQAALKNLEASNPQLYSVVADELNNMEAAATAQDDDGFDLSGISGAGLPSTQQDAATPTTTPGNELPGE